jgi:hypothetical protein
MKRLKPARPLLGRQRDSALINQGIAIPTPLDVAPFLKHNRRMLSCHASLMLSFLNGATTSMAACGAIPCQEAQVHPLDNEPRLPATGFRKRAVATDLTEVPVDVMMSGVIYAIDRSEHC